MLRLLMYLFIIIQESTAQGAEGTKQKGVKGGVKPKKSGNKLACVGNICAGGGQACVGNICAGGGKACVGTMCAGGGDTFGTDRITRICSRTCIKKKHEQCSAIARRECQQKCQTKREMPKVSIKWTASLCGLSVTRNVLVPTIILTDWMTLIQTLPFINKMKICSIERKARETPGEIILLIQKYFDTWCNSHANCIDSVERTTLQTIITKITEFITRQIRAKPQVPSRPLVTVNTKIYSWLNEMRRIANLSKIKLVLQQAINIISGAGSYMDVLPIIIEIQRVLEIQRLKKNLKEKLQILLLDMKYTILKDKVEFLLTTYDQQIKEDIKVKLSELILVEEVISGHSRLPYKRMLAQYDQIVRYVTTLIQNSILTGQVYSEMRRFLGQIRVDGFVTMMDSFDSIVRSIPSITINKLIEELKLKYLSKFRVPRVNLCTQRLCDRSILNAACMYGGRCNVFMRQGFCNVKVMQCRRETQVKRFSQEKIISILKKNSYVQTITYSMQACKELADIATKSFPFGGFDVRVNWNPRTKMCSLTMIGVQQAEARRNQQCSCGSQFDQLTYMSFQQVVTQAAEKEVVFKTPDRNTCMQYCNNQMQGQSSCQGKYDCRFQATCWVDQCVCKIRHTCTSTVSQTNPGVRPVGVKKRFLNGEAAIATDDDNEDNEDTDSESDDEVEETTIKIPQMDPVISEGTKKLKNIPKEEKTGSDYSAISNSMENGNKVHGFPKEMQYH